MNESLKLNLDKIDGRRIDHPADYLKAIFSIQDSTKEWIQRRHFTFSEPAEEAMESYDLTVVRVIRDGNIKKLREMLDEGRQFDACNKFGESLIHMACRRGDVKLVQFLVDEAKVQISICDDFGRTILHDALWTSKPNFEVVAFLLKKVPPSMLLASDVRGHTPFQYARREHWPTWIAFLRENASVILQRVSIMQAFQHVA